MSLRLGIRTLAKAISAEMALIAGIITAVTFFTVGKSWLTSLDNLPWLAVIFVWLFGVMVWCAFGVVRHAEVLAELLGEPFGTLILTISVISIEATILATVMLGGDPNPTLPRDTMFSVLMITLNGMVGLTLTVGALRFGQQQYNLQGAVAFLAVLSPLAIIALVIPKFTTSTVDPTFTPLQATVFGLLTAFLYGVFLLIQTSRHSSFFMEPHEASEPGTVPAEAEHYGASRSRSVMIHAALLVAILLPVVLLSKPMAKLIDWQIEHAGVPTPLGAILIALLILSPEGTAAIQSALRNQLQRAVNLSLGSALSTIGLTVPAVLAISVVTGTPVNLGLPPTEITLLALTLFTCQMTFSGVPTNILLGVAHLVLFAAYLMLSLYP
jgi:Ca2+:H+ antiporter